MFYRYLFNDFIDNVLWWMNIILAILLMSRTNFCSSADWCHVIYYELKGILYPQLVTCPSDYSQIVFLLYLLAYFNFTFCVRQFCSVLFDGSSVVRISYSVFIGPFIYVTYSEGDKDDEVAQLISFNCNLRDYTSLPLVNSLNSRKFQLLFTSMTSCMFSGTFVLSVSEIWMDEYFLSYCSKRPK